MTAADRLALIEWLGYAAGTAVAEYDDDYARDRLTIDADTLKADDAEIVRLREALEQARAALAGEPT